MKIAYNYKVIELYLKGNEVRFSLIFVIVFNNRIKENY